MINISSTVMNSEKRVLKQVEKKIRDQLQEKKCTKIFQEFNNTRVDFLSFVQWLNLSGLLKDIINKLRDEEKEYDKSEMYKVIYLIEENCPIFFSKIDQSFSYFLDKLYELKKPQPHPQWKSEKNKQQSYKYEKQILQALNIAQTQQGSIHSLADRIQRKEPPLSTYDQVCFNWLRDKLNTLQISRNEQYLCCRIIFLKDQLLKVAETVHQDFRDYWPYKKKQEDKTAKKQEDKPAKEQEDIPAKISDDMLSTMMNKVKKTIIAFLNRGGGIIYLGFFEDKKKSIIVKGLPLTTGEIKIISESLNKVVDEIYPKEICQKDQQKKKIYALDKHHGERIINKYISFDYNSVISPEDFTYAQQKNSKQNQFYVIRIIVKPGHPKHLYHLINKHKMMQFYVRDDKKSDKKPFQEAHKMIEQRYLAYYESEENHIRKPFHHDCRINLEDKKQMDE